MTHHRSLRALGLTAAGFASATLTHTCLAASSAVGLAGDYSSHAHFMLFPVALAAFLGSAIVALALLLHSLDCRRSGALLTIARDFASLDLKKPIGAAASTGIATLWCMESLEQLSGHGHLDGLLSAFGAAPLVGIAIVVIASAALLFGTRRLAGWLGKVGDRIVELILTSGRWTFPDLGLRDEPAYEPLTRVVEFLVARSRGLRAPPPLSA